MQKTPVQMITCECCDRSLPYESDLAASVGIYGKCAACELERRPELFNAVDTMSDLFGTPFYQAIIDERLKREKETGHRIFDCPNCAGGAYLMDPPCRMCSGRGWVRGYPPLTN